MNPIEDKNFANFISFAKFRKRETAFYLCAEAYLNSTMHDSTPKENKRAYEIVKDILDDIERFKKNGR